jgi:hypothetical protein
MRIALFLALLLPATAGADTCRVLIDGTGCHTRQQAIQRIFKKLPDVTDVTILPRRDAPADNQRYFVINSQSTSPTKETLIESLGRKAKFYKVLTVDPIRPSASN